MFLDEGNEKVFPPKGPWKLKNERSGTLYLIVSDNSEKWEKSNINTNSTSSSQISFADDLFQSNSNRIYASDRTVIPMILFLLKSRWTFTIVIA